MPIIKKIEPPFKTVEEAIAVANQHKPYEYLWKEGYVNFYVFSERYKPGEFQKKVSEYVDNALVYYGAISLFIFPFYICLCSLIFLFDYQEINYKIYLFLKSLYIPIRDPYGWNFSFLISFFINLLLFNHMRRSYNFSILIKSTKINHPVRYFFCSIMMLIMIFLFVIASFITMPEKADPCTRGSLCFLNSDSMFLYASTMSFIIFFGIGYFIYSLIYIRLDFRNVEPIDVSN